ncbi:hypothetical protein, partial [uncultured Oscillibacter sp.]|uniref:hypothetical protein n=1 Tax=uncultured Oscillibacter sp. TaxID=876091 RepID=UPI002636686B
KARLAHQKEARRRRVSFWCAAVRKADRPAVGGVLLNLQEKPAVVFPANTLFLAMFGNAHGSFSPDGEFLRFRLKRTGTRFMRF